MIKFESNPDFYSLRHVAICLKWIKEKSQCEESRRIANNAFYELMHKTEPSVFTMLPNKPVIMEKE